MDMHLRIAANVLALRSANLRIVCSIEVVLDKL